MDKPRQRKRKASPRQIKALQLINQGVSKRQSLIQAGYSVSTANMYGKKFLTRQVVKDAIVGMKDELVEQGLTTKYMAEKFKEWLEAQKITNSPTEPDREVPDYDIQLKAYDRWAKHIFDEGTDKKLKKKMTIEEFID